ncbi:hypothetical protein MMC34_002413 [Xylographa carneopallida]|nr:hypothetical protein [Xylographa carneopallida]
MLEKAQANSVMTDLTTKAIANRSLRTIRTELEFLADTSLLSASQLASILALLPDPSSSASSIVQPPATSLGNLSISEKQPSSFYSPSPSPQPPPAYVSPPTLAKASALYAYTPTDSGDLALLPNDRIQVLEFMNADWAKGRNERTGQEGIFPRSYVNILEEKNAATVLPPPMPQQNNSYGNMPLTVSQSGTGGDGAGRSKFDENGKKFGKKLGNAAIFGAGASIGGKIVGSIF